MGRKAFLASILLMGGALLAQQPPPNPRPPKPPASTNESSQDRCERERSGLDIRIYPAEGQFQPSAELLLTDPQQRRVGMDPATRKNYAEIPNGAYEFEGIDDDETGEPGPQTGIIWLLCGPLTGEYKLEVIGTEEGSYELEVFSFDDEYRSTSRHSGSVAIKPGERHEYKIVWALKPKTTLTLSRNTPAATTKD